MLYFLERVIFSEREFPARLGKGNRKPSLGSLVRKWEGEHLKLFSQPIPRKGPPFPMYRDWEFQLCSHNNFALFSRLSHFKKQNKYKHFFRLLSRFIASQIRKMQLFAASVERIKCFLSSILIKMWESLRSLCKVLKKTMQKVYAKIVKNILPLSSISAICPCRNTRQWQNV